MFPWRQLPEPLPWHPIFKSSHCNSFHDQAPCRFPLHWRHNEYDGVSNHQPRGCLLKPLFRQRSKKTSKLRVTGLCVGNSPGPVNSQHKGPVTRKMFPFDDVIMSFVFCLIKQGLTHLQYHSVWNVINMHSHKLLTVHPLYCQPGAKDLQVWQRLLRGNHSFSNEQYFSACNTIASILQQMGWMSMPKSYEIPITY